VKAKTKPWPRSAYHTKRFPKQFCALLTEAQHAKLIALGGSKWIRKCIDHALTNTQENTR